MDPKDNMPEISAYIPCYNNAKTIKQAIESVKSQSVPVEDLFVIDDGSVDNSAAIAAECGVRVIKNDTNTGRGSVRAQAMRIARNDLVLCIDGSKVIGPAFLEHALSWPLAGRVAGVFGRIVLNHTTSIAERWVNRHIYDIHSDAQVNRCGLLVTAGCLLRRSVVLEMGNFNESCRHSEDRELGRRLLAAKYEVIFDPTLFIVDMRDKEIVGALETYWRWHAGELEHVSISAYLKQVLYSFKVLACRDFRAGDPFAAFVSLLSPHYQLWRSWSGVNDVSGSKRGSK